MTRCHTGNLLLMIDICFVIYYNNGISSWFYLDLEKRINEMFLVPTHSGVNALQHVPV